MQGSPPPDSRNGSSPPPWELVETEHLQDCRVFRVSRSRARSPRTGAAHDFFRIDAEDWVNVVALTERDELVLVRQFRHGARATTLEIPGGMVDPGESPRDAALRELLEETGYAPRDARDVAAVGAVNPNPALFGNRVHTFVVRGCARIAAIANEGAEETRVELLPREHLHAAVVAGEIDHALVLAGLYFFELGERR